MTERATAEREVKLIRAAVARLRAGIMAIVFGAVCGSGLAVATLWLVVRDGPQVGRHLGLLRHYFPGYSVTWAGVGVGFFYGAVVGVALGWATAWVYNRVVNWRSSAAGRTSR